MNINVVSFVVGVIIALALLNPMELYSQVVDPSTPSTASNTVWMIFGLIMLSLVAVGIFVMWRKFNNSTTEFHGIDLAGQKGGEVEKRQTQNDIYVETLKEEARRRQHMDGITRH